jgi:hypothetical protein
MERVKLFDQSFVLDFLELERASYSFSLLIKNGGLDPFFIGMK